MSCIEKIEEAIQNIEVAVAEVEWYLPLNYAASFDMAIDALKKQIPQKIKRRYIFSDKAYDCPACGSQIEPAEYCSKCGQKLNIDYEV